MIYIGIDAGVNTGFAAWRKEDKKFIEITTLPIHTALEKVKHLSKLLDITVIVEDARKRKFYGKNANKTSVLQGVGSVKRDCKIWEDFLKDNKIPFQMVHPIKGATKLTADQFKKYTGYQGRTNEHNRDAAMLVFNK